MQKELTPEQEAKLDDYYQKWVDIGLATDRFSEEEATKIVNDFQRLVLGEEPTPVIVVDTPIEAWREACSQAFLELQPIDASEFNDMYAELMERLKAMLLKQRNFDADTACDKKPCDNVEAAWFTTLDDYAGEVVSTYHNKLLELEKSAGQISTAFEWTENVWNKFTAAFGDEIKETLQKVAAAFVANQMDDFVFPYQDGSLFAPFLSSYDFLVSENVVEFEDELNERFNAWKATSRLGLIYPMSHVCVVCQKPAKINLNEQGFLHSEDEMAVYYADKDGNPKYGFYALNGVTVPKELALTPADQLDIGMYAKIENADIQAEFVRKFGAENMMSYGNLVDSYKNYDQDKFPLWHTSQYELWDMEQLFPELDYQPYLKMMNPTTGVWHFEACSPNCRTVEEALSERWQGDMELVELS